MKIITAFLLVLVFLLQTGSRLLLVAHYQLNKSYITHAFCENKAKLALNCKGQCYLVKKLKKDTAAKSGAAYSLEKPEILYCQPFALSICFVYPTRDVKHFPVNEKRIGRFATCIFHPPRTA